MLEKHHKLQPKPKTTDELKAAPQIIGEELPQKRINKAAVNFTKRRTTPTWLWLPVAVTSSIRGHSIHLQICIILLSPTNRFFSEPLTDCR